MLKFIKKYLVFILTGSFSFILAACYGAPIKTSHFATVNTNDEEGNPIKGLKVSLNINGENLNSYISNEDGIVEFENIFLNDTTDYVVRIEDIDGEENGGLFTPEEFTLNKSDYYVINLKK